MSIGSRLILLATVLGIAHESVAEILHPKAAPSAGPQSAATSLLQAKDPSECGGTLALFYTADRRVIISKRILGWMKQCPPVHKQVEMRELATVMLRNQAEVMFDSASQLLQKCPNLLSQKNINSEEFKKLGGYGFETLRDFGIGRPRPAGSNCERKYNNVESKFRIVKLLSDPEVKGSLFELEQCKKANLASSAEDQLALQSLKDEMAREAEDVIRYCPAQLEKLSAFLDANK